MQRLKYSQWVANPIDPAKKNSPWITGRRRALSHIGTVVGQSDYQGRIGSNCFTNGIFWVEVVSRRKDGLLLISNLHDIGKIKVKNANMAIEPDFVFPQLRGRDVERWKAAPTYNIVVPQIPTDPAKGFPEAQMKANYPKTYNYFSQFEPELRKRSGFKQFFNTDIAPFYSIYNVGPYTFSPYKVCWREVATEVNAAVCGSHDSKIVVPDHTLVSVPCSDEEEAHYICGLLKSAPANFIVCGYVALHPSPHVMKYIKIAKFKPKDKTHRALAANSKALHAGTAAGDTARVEALEAENLELAAAYWGLEKSEVADIKASLEELA